jgi:hypothetical protein
MLKLETISELQALHGTVTVTHWLGMDGAYSIRLWTSSHTAATAFRASSSSRPSGSISRMVKKFIRDAPPVHAAS